MSERAPSTTRDNGWWRTKPLQPSWHRLDRDERAVEAKVRGIKMGKAMTCAVSLWERTRTDGGKAQLHGVGEREQDQRSENNRRGPRHRCGNRRRRHPVITITTKMLRTASAVVRPASTAERAIGSARKRSIGPSGDLRPDRTLVLTAPNMTVCTKIPASCSRRRARRRE